MSEGQSYSNVEFMNSLPKVNAWAGMQKNNASTGLTIEQIEGEYGIAFMPHLVKGSKFYFYNRDHRHEVMKSDPIANFLLERWISEVTSKRFKSYDEEENEYMMDFWERWEMLNLNEPLRDIYESWGGDGYCIGFMYPSVSGGIGYKTFGFYECPPEFWKRYNLKDTEFHNVIYEYRISVIPIPSGYQYLGNYNIHAEEMFLYPDQTPGFFHFTRDTWNYGVGVSKIQPIWASMTKLREIAYADYRRSSIFNIFEFPEDWDEEKGLLAMIEAARRANSRTGIAVPKRINPNSGEVEDWPKFYERSWDTEGGAPRADPSSGGSLLRSAEYARLLIPLGYTETKLVGSQPGEVTGSKLDLTRDDEVDVREFNLLKPVIKWIANWCLENGFLEGLEAETLEAIQMGNFDIKCHTEWEIIENQMKEAELAADMAEDQAETQATQNIAPELLVDTKTNTTIIGIRTNAQIPMTEIGGGKLAGVSGGNLLVKFPNYPHAGVGYPGGGTYSYHFGDEFQALGAYTDIGVGGGKYVWRVLRGKGIGPAYITGNPTRGGTKASLVPYDIIGGTPQLTPSPGILEGPSQQQVSQSPSQDPGGVEFTPYSYGTIPSQTTTSQTPSQGINYTAGPNITKKAKTKTNPKGAGKKQKRGRKKGGTTGGAGVVGTQTTSYVPATAYNSLSFEKANSYMKAARGKGFSKTTWGEVRRFTEIVDNANMFRTNSMDIGNPMSFDVKLRYMQNGKVAEEYACKKEWKKLNKHKGNLYLYEDLEHGGNKHIVGTYKYSWNTTTDMPSIKRNYDDNKIRDLHTEWGISESPILDKLNLGLPLSMSTEYFCGTMTHNNKTYQVDMHNGRGVPEFKGIAIVKRGNCDDPFCSFTAEEVT